MEEQSDTPYFLSTCAPYSETAAANPMRAYSREDCAEIIAHEGGTAYVLAEDYERELAAATRERDEARAEGVEQARLLGISGAREAALMAKVDAITRERDEARAALRAIKLDAASLADAQVIALEALAATEAKP